MTFSEASRVALGKYVQVSSPLTSPNDPVQGVLVFPPVSEPYARWPPLLSYPRAGSL